MITEEHRINLRKSHLGQIPWNKGKKMSAEICLKNSFARKGKKHSKETKNKIGEARIGKPRSEETKEKLRLALIGNKNGIGNKSGLGKKFSDEHKQKIRIGNLGKKLSIKTKQKLSELHKGKNNPMWKGGITPINHSIRDGLEYRLWREKVFKRDNYACQSCNKRSGNGKAVILHSHHIKSFSDYPERRFWVSNGITLCKDCHKKTNNYFKNVKKIEYKQIELAFKEVI